MATGWAKDGAVQDQIDASIDDAVKAARRHLPKGPSLKQCEDCGADIYATIDREQFGMAAGKEYGFSMAVDLRIQVEAIAAK